MGARCTSQDADSMPISQKEQWREMLQENPQILLQLEYQKMQLSLLQEIREERLHYEDLLNRRLMQDKQFRRNDDFQLNDDFQRNDAFREISRVSASILPSHATTRYGCSSVDDSYLEEYSAFTAQEDAKISRTGSVSSSRQRRSYSVGSVQDLQKKLQKRTFNSQRRETLDMTNPILKRDPAVGGNKAIENGFGNRKTDRASKESPSRANRNSNSDSGSSSKQNDSYPEFEENWKGSDSQSKIITIDTFGGVKQIATSRTTASLYEKQKYISKDPLPLDCKKDWPLPFNAGGVTAAKIQNLYQKDENWKLLEAAFKKDDCDAKSETTISTLASEHGKTRKITESTMLSYSVSGKNNERGVRLSYERGVRESFTPSISPKMGGADLSTTNPTRKPQRKDDLPSASCSSERSVISDSLNISVLSGEWDRLLEMSSVETSHRVYTKEDERRLCKRRPSIPCEN